MENVFDEVLGSTPETPETEVSSADTSELGSEYDLDLSDFQESEEESANEVDDVTDESADLETPTNQAFKQMRVRIVI